MSNGRLTCNLEGHHRYLNRNEDFFYKKSGVSGQRKITKEKKLKLIFILRELKGLPIKVNQIKKGKKACKRNNDNIIFEM